MEPPDNQRLNQYQGCDEKLLDEKLSSYTIMRRRYSELENAKFLAAISHNELHTIINYRVPEN